MRFFAIAAVLLIVSPVRGSEIAPSEPLNALVAKVAKDSVEQFKEQKLKDEEFSITVIDLRDPSKLTSGSFRGDASTYPASVVKLFYLGAVHRWLEDGKLQDSDELRRAMSDMIVKSTNDATNWVLEAVTDAGNGPLLSDDEWKKWLERRNSINRYYQSLGYSGINTAGKTFVEGPYGRDRLFLGKDFENRNKLTTDATARLMAEIALRKMVSADRSEQMLKLLQRDPTIRNKNPDDQNWGFSGTVVPKGSKLWCKSGWTNANRHDAAYIETPDGLKVVVVVFTTGHGSQRQILPAIVGKIVEGMPKN